MTYQETLDYMYSQLPMYQRQGSKAFKKDLTNIKRISSALGDPHQSFESIHIAGTNGKGTVAHIIAGALQGHGLRVGMYTSPHYIDFRERIKINGEFIPEEKVIDFVAKNRQLFEEVGPSFFEMTVAMAFQYFADQQVDVAIIETGLGGRLDSTNIITPIISVITNISYDHQSMLGNTLPLIAAEKAGIIKNKIPVVIGEYGEEVHSIFADKAIQMDSKMQYADALIQIDQQGHGLSCQVNNRQWVPPIQLGPLSSFFIKNMKTAIATLHCLKDRYGLQGKSIASGIETMNTQTYYIGRYQKLSEHPTVLVDSAHNVAGVEELYQNIKEESYKRLHIVVGMVNDKDISDVLSLLPCEAIYYFVKADIPRGLPANELRKTASRYKLSGSTHKTVRKGYLMAKACADQEDLILVMGSIFVVAEVLAHVSQSPNYK